MSGLMRPRDPRTYQPRQHAVAEIDPSATEEEAKWTLEAAVHELLKRVPDPRTGEITITFYAGMPRHQVRAIWEPNRP